MPDRLLETISEWRNKGFSITDEVAVAIYNLCLRKIEIAKVEDPDYIYLMYPDEVKHYLYRKAVNAYG